MIDDKKDLWMWAWNMFVEDTPVIWIPEHNFDSCLARKHRFDWAIPEYKIAVEVDGGVWLPHGGRHGTDKDREKLNIAAMLGWSLFRFSPTMLQSDPEMCVGMVSYSIRHKKQEMTK